MVLDFNEVDWTGLNRTDFLQSERVSGVQFGAYVPGWSRLVLELGAPMAVDTAELAVAEDSGSAMLSLNLKGTDFDTFNATAGAPRNPGWDLPEPADVPQASARSADRPLRVMLDPGHGGIDPGAEIDGVDEKP